MIQPAGRPYSYRLIVPTYDRPALLSRLLDYLERQRADFSIVVLDSSHDGVRAANATRIARSPLSIRLADYATDVHPFLKIRDGLKLVTTACCSICADDDVLVLPALRECLALLDERSEVSAVHGSYFNFVESEFFDLSAIMYRGPSVIADAPLDRLRQLFARYEAVFYAVYRTHIMQEVFGSVGEVGTTLARELLTAALTAVSGQIVRIADFYYGRNTGASLAYEHWHPFQIFASSPELIFREYPIFRQIVLDALSRTCGPDRSAADTATILDLIFLRYLGQFLGASVLDVITADRLQGMTTDATVEHVWKAFVRPRPRLYLREPLREPLIRRGLARLVPDRIAGRTVPRDYLVPGSTARGTRTYRVFHEFLFPDRNGPAVVQRQTVLALCEQLNGY